MNHQNQAWLNKVMATMQADNSVVAHVLRVEGSITITRPDGTTHALKAGDVIKAYDKIVNADGSQMELQWNDGRVEVVNDNLQSVLHNDFFQQAIATVESIDGQAFAVSPDGKMRALKAGDEVFLHEIVVSENGQIDLTFFDGTTYSVEHSNVLALSDATLHSILPQESYQQIARSYHTTEMVDATDFQDYLSQALSSAAALQGESAGAAGAAAAGSAGSSAAGLLGVLGALAVGGAAAGGGGGGGGDSTGGGSAGPAPLTAEQVLENAKAAVEAAQAQTLISAQAVLDAQAAVVTAQEQTFISVQAVLDAQALLMAAEEKADASAQDLIDAQTALEATDLSDDIALADAQAAFDAAMQTSLDDAQDLIDAQNALMTAENQAIADAQTLTDAQAAVIAAETQVLADVQTLADAESALVVAQETYDAEQAALAEAQALADAQAAAEAQAAADAQALADANVSFEMTDTNLPLSIDLSTVYLGSLKVADIAPTTTGGTITNAGDSDANTWEYTRNDSSDMADESMEFQVVGLDGEVIGTIPVQIQVGGLDIIDPITGETTVM